MESCFHCDGLNLVVSLNGKANEVDYDRFLEIVEKLRNTKSHSCILDARELTITNLTPFFILLRHVADASKASHKEIILKGNDQILRHAIMKPLISELEPGVYRFLS